MSNGKKVIPGWNEYVKEYSDKAKACHKFWVQNGKPRDGEIAKERRISRLQYHYAIRYVVKENMRIRNSKMADAVSKNNDRILWDEVRKMSKTNKELPHIIDGHSNVEEVTDIFANKNKILYNSVSYSKHDMDNLSANIDEHIEIDR